MPEHTGQLLGNEQRDAVVMNTMKNCKRCHGAYQPEDEGQTLCALCISAKTAVHHVETASEKRWKLIGGIVVFCLLCYFSPGFLPFVRSFVGPFLALMGLVYVVHLYREGNL